MARWVSNVRSVGRADGNWKKLTTWSILGLGRQKNTYSKTRARKKTTNVNRVKCSGFNSRSHSAGGSTEARSAKKNKPKSSSSCIYSAAAENGVSWAEWPMRDVRMQSARSTTTTTTGTPTRWRRSGWTHLWELSWAEPSSAGSWYRRRRRLWRRRWRGGDEDGGARYGDTSLSSNGEWRHKTPFGPSNLGEKIACGRFSLLWQCRYRNDKSNNNTTELLFTGVDAWESPPRKARFTREQKRAGFMYIYLRISERERESRTLNACRQLSRGEAKKVLK